MKTIHIKQNYEEMSKEAAALIRSVIEENKKAVIVLATGHSPKAAYCYLAESIRQKPLDLSEVTFVKLDEWAGLTRADEASCEHFIWNEVLKPLSVSEEQYLHFRADAPDLKKECERIQQEYDKLPSIDLVILGIGMNGHLGLNEPAQELHAYAHETVLSKKTKTHELLQHTKEQVEAGVTLGMENLFKGKQILLLADGAEKEKGLEYFLNDLITTQVPVSLLKLHPNCCCIINRECFPDLI